MTRAAQACTHHDCPNLQPCAVHPRKAWAKSSRSEHTKLSGWAQQRRARMILTKYAAICHVCGEGGADQVDHVDPLSEGGADDATNLRPIHSDPCHTEKTAEEARRARSS